MEAGKNGVGSAQERGRERKRGADWASERRSIGENQKWRGLRNDCWKRLLFPLTRHHTTQCCGAMTFTIMTLSIMTFSIKHSKRAYLIQVA